VARTELVELMTIEVPSQFRQFYSKRFRLLDALRGGFPSPEFGSKPRPQLPNRHGPAVDVDSKPLIRFGAASHFELAHENDMTGKPQFINPLRDKWAGGPQGIFVCVRHRQAKVVGACNWD
jgi:hypothetical protein